jgi:sec-independent protein translocase protein TatB
MFEVGFSELLVIFVLALVVLGPEKLPRLAQQVGRWIGRARAMAKQFREQLEDEVNLADMKKWQETSSQSTSTSSSSTSSTSPSDASSSSAHATSHSEGSSTQAHAADTAQNTSAPAAAAVTPESAPAAGTPEQSTPSHGPGHYAGPPAEPEASVYQPPAYASAGTPSSANGSTPHATSGEAAHAVESAAAATQSNSTASHDPAPASDERPARPGDVITHTHERGI